MLLFAEQSSRRMPPESVPINFDSRGYSSLFYLRRKPTRSLRSPISSDAILATLVHAPVLLRHSIESVVRVFARGRPRGDSIAPVVDCRDAGNDAVWEHAYGV